MVYTFACPVPCNRVIEVYANTDDDAINKMIVAGAMSCRNMANQKYCEMDRYDMPSLPEAQLREIVRLSMEAESVDGMPTPMTMTMSEKMTKKLDGFYSAASTVRPGVVARA
jgi:hypothetical protein